MSSPLDPGHPDHSVLKPIFESVVRRVGTLDVLRERLPEIISGAIEFVVDPVRTARTSVADLDNVEKTFIGLKIEHFFRDFIDLPKGARDLSIDGVDLDVKNTVGTTWMIPPETYRLEEPCLLIASAQPGDTCSLGLLVARDTYLSKPNRDQKRGVNKMGRQNVLWLVERASMPVNPWHGLDMMRFRQLRKEKPGARRAALFFTENIGRPVSRSVVESLLFDQEDPMKRLRGNGGARDLLAPAGIELLSGPYDKKRLIELQLPLIREDEFVAIRTPA